MKSKKQFTLIELIVVIAIVIILAASAIMILSSYIVKARDTRRSADLRSMQTALETAIVNNAKYTFPDGEIKITASGTTIMYQGQFGSTVSKTVNMSKEPKDPGDDTYYTYSVNAAQKKYALMTLMENAVAMNRNNANAINYSTRIPNLAGDKIGILLDSSNTPLQEKKTGTFTDINLTSNKTGYNIYFNNSSKVNGTGKQLLSAIINVNPNGKEMASYDDSLVGYWDIETLTSDGKLKDNSKYNNNGIINGAIFIEGKVGKSLKFDGINDYVEILNNSSLNFTTKGFSLIGWINIIGEANAFAPAMFDKSNGDFTNRNVSTKGYWLSVGKTANPIRDIRFGISDGVLLNYDLSDYSLNNSLLLNKWIFISAICEDSSISNPKLKLYINGNLVSEGTKQHNNSIDNTYNLYFGKRRYEDRYLNGSLDELRIYNRALSDEEIKALYDASK